MQRAVARGLVRRQEHRARMAQGDQILKGTKYRWLESPKDRSWSAAKRRAGGFRSRERFRIAIYFHCGGLDLYPASKAAGS
jgi:hypothetical protein